MGVTAMLLRGAAANGPTSERVLSTAWVMGFDLLARVPVTKAEVKALETSGPDWLAAGTSPPSAGTVVFLHDPLPHLPPPSQPRHLALDNLRNERLCARLTAVLGHHCGDDSWSIDITVKDQQAWELADALVGGELRKLHQENRLRAASLINPPDVLTPLSIFGERARVDLVEHRGQLAVRKTFRPGRERYLNRELTALRDLAGQIPQIPELLDVGTDHVVMRHYRDRLGIDGNDLTRADRLVPLSVAESAIAVIRSFYDLGYALVDCHLGHFLLDPTHGLKVIDFEFLHRYETVPARFEECFDLAGVPDWFDELDVPVPVWMLPGDPYSYYWKPHTGLDLAVLIGTRRVDKHLGRLAHRTRTRQAAIRRSLRRNLRRPIGSLIKKSGIRRPR